MDHGWIDGDDSVPEISEDRLAKLIKKIKPLIMKGDKLYRFKLPDLRRTAFTWEPKNLKMMKGEFVIKKTIKTNHSCGYHAFFKPSIAEVLAHIPEEADISAEYGKYFYIEPGYVDIFQSGSGHRATTHFGVIK